MVTTERLTIGIIGLLLIFGPISVMFLVMFFLKRFSIKWLKVFTVLSIIIQFGVTMWFYYFHRLPSDNLGFGFLFFFWVIPVIVITYLLLIKLLEVKKLAINKTIIILLLSIVTGYLFLMGFETTRVYAKFNNNLIAAAFALLDSVILSTFPVIKLFQIWRQEKALIK